VFVDQNIFGFSRTGLIDNQFKYPLLLEPGNNISYDAGTFKILNQSVSVPDPNPDMIMNDERSKILVIDDFIIIPDGMKLLLRPRRLLNKINDLIEKFGFSKLIYLQGVADPYLLPMLVYSGISIFDSSLFELEGMSGVKFTALGNITTNTDNAKDNVKFARDILDLVSLSIANGTLRDLVEKFQLSAKAVEILRILDRDYKDQSREFFPSRTPSISAYSIDSLSRPDLEIYRNYIQRDYRKPEGREIALILPCSARKPYSTSRSHRKIISKLANLRPFVHEIIVTSPVGIVPRELESVYPPAFYDIPVTGQWLEEEKDMIGSMLSSYFDKNRYSNVVSFVTGDLSFIHRFLPEDTIEIEWNKKSDESLEKLRSTISDLIRSENMGRKRVNYDLEKYIQIAKFQFGGWIEDYLDGAKIKRIYNSDMLMIDGNPALVYNEKLGKFTINKLSGKWFVENNRSCVEIDDFKPTASIYPVGIIGATPDIRQEDEVAIHHCGELRGVGIAKMPRRFMLQIKKGVAVKVRN